MSLPDPQRATQENIKLRDPASFQQLYQRYQLSVFRFIYGLQGGPTEEVEDLTAETFIRAWKSRRRFKGSEQAALGWLLKIARNLVIDRYRHRKTLDFVQDVEEYAVPEGHPGPEEQALLKEQVQILWALLQKLPAQQREILVLRYLLNWRVNEIADHLDMKENTVSVYIRRALKYLRQSWPEKNDDA